MFVIIPPTCPATELNLDFLWIPLKTDVILAAFPFPGTQVVSEGFYHLQVMLNNSVFEIIQFILFGSWRWDGDMGTGRVSVSPTVLGDGCTSLGFSAC